jgi:transposase
VDGFKRLSTYDEGTKLYDALEEEGIPVVLANPYKTRVIAKSRIKNYKVDTAILADLLWAGMIA